ncbi:hypothetical protein [Sorangium sp. So ce1335]|uniref:hypothetical protein n=1 Tax=Sorangium sp. So ce1335 TaxID=3133335 RepID=UPI003F5FF7EF
MNTSISLFLGLMMLQTFGAGCTALVEVGDDSDDSGNVSTGSGSPVGSGGGWPTAESGSVSGSSSVGSGNGVGTGGGSPVGSGAGWPTAESGSVSGSSSVGSGGSGSTGSGSGPTTASAVAFLGSELPDPSDEPGSSSATGGGPSPGPDDLYVLIGAPALSCAEPYVGCDAWHVSFIIPPAAQVPGIYPLNGRDLTASFGVNGPDRGSGSCGAFGGTFGPGVLEIVSIDATKVVVRLSDTPTSEFDANGEYTAVRCP